MTKPTKTMTVRDRQALEILRSLALTHHKARAAFMTLEKNMAVAYQAGITEVRFEPFESLRLPYRQDHLFAGKTSKARAWQSAHQYGLAVDFVPRVMTGERAGRWTWDRGDLGQNDMSAFRERVRAVGLLADLEWDPFHVEHPIFREIRMQVV